MRCAIDESVTNDAVSSCHQIHQPQPKHEMADMIDAELPFPSLRGALSGARPTPALAIRM